MKRLQYVDLNILDDLELPMIQKPDPSLAAAVQDALKAIEPDLARIVRMRFYEGHTMIEIAGIIGKTERETSSLLYEAKRQLRELLAEYVAKRWGIKTKGICGVCSHPQRSEIEHILVNKDNGESWSKITEKIRLATGEIFHPPQILKAHLSHMKSDRRNDNDKR